MKEYELSQPIRQIFEAQGFAVDGEVGDVDILCQKQDITIAIELKKDLNFKVFLQAAKRQKICDMVYIGCYMPDNLKTKAFKDKMYLLKRLGLGLILVSKRTAIAQIYQQPLEVPLKTYQSRNSRGKQQVIAELQNRKLRDNQGGINKTKIVTAYMEDCLIVLYYLAQLEHQLGSVAQIKEQTGLSKAGYILSKNFYGWFERAGRGIYQISLVGKQALSDYQNHIERLTAEFNKGETLNEKSNKK